MIINTTKSYKAPSNSELRRRADNKYGAQQVKQDTVFIDYCSFTWVPERLNAIRKVALLKIKAKEYVSLSDYIKANLSPEEVELLDTDLRQNMTRFLTVVSAQFFTGAAAVADCWEEFLIVKERSFGMFGYRSSWELYFNGQLIGVAASGAKNGGCYVSFTGLGCSLIDFKRLHAEIKDFPNIRLTRVDAAFDDYQGVYSVDLMKAKYIDGDFITGGKPPKYQYFEGGHLDFDKDAKKGEFVTSAGCTFYVGSREGGKLYRAYEKGKQLGSPASTWVRHELELRSTNREIPLWSLLRPGDILTGAYPALSFIQTFVPDVIPTPVKTKKRNLKISYDRSVESLQRVGGALINVMREARGMSDAQIVEALIGAPHSCPASLRKIAVSLEIGENNVN